MLQFNKLRKHNKYKTTLTIITTEPPTQTELHNIKLNAIQELNNEHVIESTISTTIIREN